MKKYDLIVVGGGFSGTAAAIAAARGGARVLLVDKSNCLGGAASNCLVNPFTRFSTTIDGEKVFLVAGIFKEIRSRLEARGAMMKALFLEEELKVILNDMVREAGVDLLFHAYLTRVEKEKGFLKKATFASVGGEISLEADYFIDATGDAQLSYLAGVPTVLGRKEDNLCQPMTLCFRVGNADVEAFFQNKDQLNAIYKEAQKNGEIKNPRENILAFRSLQPGVIHFNTTRIVKLDPSSAFDLTKAELQAREQVFEIFEFMKKHGKGLENSFLMMTAPEIGVRESRMIVGDYVLTGDDCINCVKFEDAIAACNYSIDIHNPEGSGTYIHKFEPGEFFTIPYRALVPKTLDNVLVVGRCISSDHVAQASYRTMGTVTCIGQAAGTAMAQTIRAKKTTREVDVKELQNKLKADSAFIGI